jgi:hypothetical protein
MLLGSFFCDSKSCSSTALVKNTEFPSCSPKNMVQNKLKATTLYMHGGVQQTKFKTEVCLHNSENITCPPALGN